MYCLTESQITWIGEDLRKRGIRRESLHEQLLDHICCLLEAYPDPAADFNTLYGSVITAFYEQELAEIETETTLLLTFHNYYTMRKLMLISGTFAVAAFIAGSFLKLFHLPGASVLLVSGIVVISLIFLPLLLALKFREAADGRQKTLLTLGTVIGALYCLSSLFLVQHWPGARVLWFSTLILTFFGFIPYYFISGMRYTADRLNTMVVTILLIAATGIQFTLTALRRPAPATAQHTIMQAASPEVAAATMGN